MKIIHSKQYHTGYPGGPNVFLNKWEYAAVRYNRVDEPGWKINISQLIDYFSIGFKVINDKENIIEQAKDTISTFDKLTGALRTKLTQRDYLYQWDSSTTRYIHQMELQAQKDRDFNASQTYINAISVNDPEWRVGQKLWKILTLEQQKLIVF